MAERKMAIVDAPATETVAPKVDIYATVLEPVGHRVLVYPDQISDRRGSLFVPDSVRKQEQYAHVFGTLVKIGPQAWMGFDDGRPWAKVGDRVVFAKYGGLVLEDPETKELYRCLNDEDVVATLNTKPKEA